MPFRATPFLPFRVADPTDLTFSQLKRKFGGGESQKIVKVRADGRVSLRLANGEAKIAIWTENGFEQNRKNEPFQRKNPNLRPNGRFFGSDFLISATGKNHFPPPFGKWFLGFRRLGFG